MDYPPSVSKFHRVLYHPFPKLTSHFQKNCRRNSGGRALLIPIGCFYLIPQRLKDFNYMQKFPICSTNFPCFRQHHKHTILSGGHTPMRQRPPTAAPALPRGGGSPYITGIRSNLSASGSSSRSLADRIASTVEPQAFATSHN